MKFELYRAIGASDLPSAPKLLAFILLGYADSQGRNAFPSNTTLAKQCGWKDKSTVKRHMRVLVDAGLVRVTPRKDSSGDLNLTNVYEFVHNWGVGAAQPPPGARETPLGFEGTPPGATETPGWGLDNTEGGCRTDPQSVPLPDPLSVKSAATLAMEGLRIVKAAAPDGFPRRAAVDLARKVDELLAEGTAVELVVTAVDMWMSKPTAGVGLLPHLVGDAAKAMSTPKVSASRTNLNSARTPTSRERKIAELELRKSQPNRDIVEQGGLTIPNDHPSIASTASESRALEA